VPFRTCCLQLLYNETGSSKAYVPVHINYTSHPTRQQASKIFYTWNNTNICLHTYELTHKSYKITNTSLCGKLRACKGSKHIKEQTNQNGSQVTYPWILGLATHPSSQTQYEKQEKNHNLKYKKVVSHDYYLRYFALMQCLKFTPLLNCTQ
jgi:hypothetical protein